MKTIGIIGTFDTKGKEFLYIKELIESLGLKTFTIHTGGFKPEFEPNISNDIVALEGGKSIEELMEKKDRALTTETLSKGLKKLLPRLYKEGKFHGVISLGGSGGTSIAAPAMRELPLGVPKIIVSTMASGNTTQYVGTSDLILIPSIVDVAGLNSISIKIFNNAVFAIAGMLSYETNKEVEKKPLIAATMFGVTTPCVDYAKKYMNDRGYEVLVFHATGTGGKAMEDLIKTGHIQGVLDFTTTEWCDEIVGGVLTAGENRLEAAAQMGIPQVVSTGALDMVNFGPYDTVPKEFITRNLYRHNPTVTLMRTSIDENKKIGEKIAEKLNMSKGKTTLILPLKGVSDIDREGQPFYGAKEDEMLFDTLKKNVDKGKVEIIELENNINDKYFAETAAKKLIDLMTK